MNIKEASIKTIMAVAGLLVAILLTISAWSFAVGGWRANIEKDVKRLQGDVAVLKQERKESQKYRLEMLERLARLDVKMSSVEATLCEIKAWPKKDSVLLSKKKD